NDGWIMNLVLGVMYILFPLSWFGMMGWTGVHLGNFATQIVGDGAKLPQTAGNEGGKQIKDAAVSVITKGKGKLK
ncbi:conjugal transfer protein TraG, partial [Salmonella enterica subsp. enterica serovar Newport str. CFSAN000835]